MAAGARAGPGRPILSLVRQTRGGALYVSKFGERMRGTGPYAEMIAHRFQLAARRVGLDKRSYGLDTGRFRVPPASKEQLSLQL